MWTVQFIFPKRKKICLRFYGFSLIFLWQNAFLDERKLCFWCCWLVSVTRAQILTAIVDVAQWDIRTACLDISLFKGTICTNTEIELPSYPWLSPCTLSTLVTGIVWFLNAHNFWSVCVVACRFCLLFHQRGEGTAKSIVSRQRARTKFKTGSSRTERSVWPIRLTLTKMQSHLSFPSCPRRCFVSDAVQTNRLFQRHFIF